MRKYINEQKRKNNKLLDNNKKKKNHHVNNNKYEKKINVNNTTTILSKPLPVESRNNTTSRTNNIILLTKYNDKIINAGRENKHEDILNILSDMKHEKCWPTVLTYDLAIRACVQSQKIDPLAINIIRDMRSLGLRIEERTACCILNGSKNVLPSKILDEIRKSGLAPVGKVRKAYILALCNSGQLTQAYEDFKTALSTSSLLRVGDDIFIHFFDSCKRRTRATTILEFFQLIDVCRAPKTLDVFESLINCLIRARCCRDAMPFLKQCIDMYGVKKTLPCIYSLIVAFGEINKLKTSKDLHAFICQNGFQSSPYATAALLKACARGKSYEDLMSIFAQAAKDKMLPKQNVELYSEIMAALCDATRSADCAEIIDTLQQTGHSLGANPRLLSYLVTALVQAGQMSEAIQLFMTIGGKTDTSSGIGPTLAKLVEEVGNHGDVIQLNNISRPIQTILNRRLEFEEILWGKLIEAYLKCGEVMTAVNYYYDMVHLGIVGSRCGMNNAMIAFSILRRENMVQKLLAEILETHGSMSRDTFQALIRSYAKLEDEEKVSEYVDLFLLCERFRRLRAVRGIRKWWFDVVLINRPPTHNQLTSSLTPTEGMKLAMKPCYEKSVNQVEDTIEEVIITRIKNGNLQWAKNKMIDFHKYLRLLRPYVYYSFSKMAINKNNDVENACWGLTQLKPRDIPPARPIFNDVIAGFSQNNNYEAAKAILVYFMEFDCPSRQMLHSLLQCVKDDNPIGIYDTFVKRGVVANEISIGLLIEALLRLNMLSKAVDVWKTYRNCEGMGPIPPNSMELLFDVLVERKNKDKKVEARTLRLATKVATDLERCNHPIHHDKAFKLYTYTLPEEEKKKIMMMTKKNDDDDVKEKIGKENDINSNTTRTSVNKKKKPTSTFMKKFEKWNNNS